MHVTSTLEELPAGIRRDGAADERASRLLKRLPLELLLIAVVFLGYRKIRVLTRDHGVQALTNADRVVAFERELHIFGEQALQGLVLHSHHVISALNWYYASAHFPLTSLFLVWLYWRQHSSYARIRTWFVTVTVAALLIHIAFPLAPPRMLTGYGFVDTLQEFGPRIYSADTTTSVANQFAAMPSLHVGWAVMVGVSVVSIRRTRRSLLVLLHPAITLLAVVATANHYWLDAIVALVLAAAVWLGLELVRNHERALLGAGRSLLRGWVELQPAALAGLARRTPFVAPTTAARPVRTGARIDGACHHGRPSEARSDAEGAARSPLVRADGRGAGPCRAARSDPDRLVG